jgi:hypothetical protein
MRVHNGHYNVFGEFLLLQGIPEAPEVANLKAVFSMFHKESSIHCCILPLKSLLVSVLVVSAQAQSIGGGVNANGQRPGLEW